MSLQTGKMCPEHPDTEMLYNGNKSRMNCPRRDCTFDVPVTAGTIKALEPQAEVSILYIPTMTILSEQVVPPVFTKKKKDPAVASPSVELTLSNGRVLSLEPVPETAPIVLNEAQKEEHARVSAIGIALNEKELRAQRKAAKLAARKERDQAELAKSSIGPIAEMHDRAARKEREDLASAREAFAKVDLAPRRPPLSDGGTGYGRNPASTAQVAADVATAMGLDDQSQRFVDGIRASSGDRPMSAFERAQNAFIDGPIATLGEAFVALYLSTRKHSGVEAAAALEACRAAFDACNLELADVEVRAGIKAVVGGAEPKLTKHVAAKARVSSKRAGRKAAAKGKKR